MGANALALLVACKTKKRCHIGVCPLPPNSPRHDDVNPTPDGTHSRTDRDDTSSVNSRSRWDARQSNASVPGNHG